MRREKAGFVCPFVPHERDGAVAPMGEVISRYYLRLSVIDKPGTLATKIAAILGKADIGISSVIQPEGHEGESVPLILMIHDATNANMARALEKNLAVFRPSRPRRAHDPRGKF